MAKVQIVGYKFSKKCLSAVCYHKTVPHPDFSCAKKTFNKRVAVIVNFFKV